ncbi:hypothetical protein Nmel_016751, partial [Mimus melanotis]
MFSRRK